MSVYSTHGILRAYIALARSERIEGRFTDEDFELALKGEFRHAELKWDDDVKLVKAVEELRHIPADVQFVLGIARTPSRLENVFICHELVKKFGLETVAAIPQFDPSGLLMIEPRKDFIVPVRKGKWITRLTFYSIREMKEWKQKQRAI